MKEGSDILKAASRFIEYEILSSELKKKLLRKGYSIQEVDDVIARFEREGYLNDREVALSYARKMIEERFKSFYYIYNKLRQKGLDETLLDEVMAFLQSNYDEADTIKKILKHNNYNNREKAISSLLRKGFKMDDVIRVISALFDN